MRRKGSLTHEKLVEEARFVLRNLQRNDVFGERVLLSEAERVLDPTLSFGFAEFVGFLTKYGYLRLDPESRTVAVTTGGMEVADAEDAEFHARLARHFGHELTTPSGRPRVESGSSTFDSAPTTASRRPMGPDGAPLDEVLDRRYRRGPLLGRGTLGTVHRGAHVSLGRAIAIKEASTVFQFASYLRRDEIVRRVRSTVEAHARLAHPHIIQVLDQNPEREHPYFVMEFAAGGSLRRRLQDAETGQVEPQVAVRVLTQIAYALRYAHEHGVLHLGLKPENVLFDGLGNVRLADFGMARVLDHPEGSGPAPVLVGGNSIGYLSPERLQPGGAGQLGPAADVYALGIVFYEMITGRLPGRRSPLPSAAREGLPETFDEVFDRMTRDALSERYATVDEVLDGVYEAFGSELVYEKGTILAWAEDPHPLPEVEADLGTEPLDPEHFEPLAPEPAPSEPGLFEPIARPPAESAGDAIAADLPVPASGGPRRAPPPPPPDD